MGRKFRWNAKNQTHKRRYGQQEVPLSNQEIIDIYYMVDVPLLQSAKEGDKG